MDISSSTLVAAPPLHAVKQPLSAVDLATQQAHLRDLQGNLLKGHGRHHAAHVFLRFSDASRAQDWISNRLKPRLTSAWQQLEDARLFRETGQDGGLFTVFFLTAQGLDFLGRDLGGFDPVFIAGMTARSADLNDPPPADWEPGLRDQAHALVLIADARQANVRFLAQELALELQGIADVVQVEFGDQQHNERHDGIEHFGYVDGRSQPLLLESDLAGESDGHSVWEPMAGPALALVPDPLGAPGSSGSYFVFRKLEQNVRGFKRREQQLANAMGLVGDARELAGAMVVGRFEDGTPVTLSREPMIEGSKSPSEGAVPNNFDYRADAAGLKCPFHAHIRKSNPRGSGPGGLDDENSRRMVRRGITYGDRADDGSDLDALPEGGVGLLFMAYQARIADQFEFIQRRWVNDPVFPHNHGGTGIDPVIGQAPGAPAQSWPGGWGDGAAPRIDLDFSGFVTLKGGYYLFAPSLSGL